jgi:hypothetical protein
MLSAGHCGSEGYWVATPPNKIINGTPDGTIFGEVVSKDSFNKIDALLIKPSSAATFEGKIYAGAWNAASTSKYRVIGTMVSYPGMLTCTSGAFTGEHCGLEIIPTNLTITTTDGKVYKSIAVARSCADLWILCLAHPGGRQGR